MFQCRDRLTTSRECSLEALKGISLPPLHEAVDKRWTGVGQTRVPGEEEAESRGT